MKKNKLIGFAIIVIFGLIMYKTTMSNISVAWNTITEDQLRQKLPPDGFLLIDVRTKQEFNDGHIPGAVLMPLQTFETDLQRLDINQEIIIYCYSGKRSARAAAILSNYGFKKINNYSAGIQGWTGIVQKDGV